VAADTLLASLGPESLPLLHELGEVLELGVFTLDRNLTVTGWNRWLAAASGQDASKAVGRPLLELFPELRGGQAEEALRRALGGATTVWAHRFHRYLLPLPPAAGHDGFTHMQQSARILPTGAGGAIDGVLVLVQDVTERVAREEELHEALRRAEVASQAKSDFLASMSHELRTPLSAIVGFMDLLEGEMVGAVTPLQKTYLGRVKSAARHLINIIEEILTFSRVEAGKELLHVEAVDAGALARDVEELFEPQALHKGLRLSVSVPDTPVALRTDATKIRQILINLLGNAMKFTDTGEVALEMRVEGDRVLFRIRDTGPGIDAVDLGRIFDPFTQVDQSFKRTKGGTGLGLPVSRRLAHLLGGDLLVDSDVGRGTSFTLWVPLTPNVTADHGGTTTGNERTHAAAAEPGAVDLSAMPSIRGTGESTAPRQRSSS
jgi:two-component system, sensor histidine kinase and response regulator